MTATEQDEPRIQDRVRPGPVRRIVTWLIAGVLVLLCLLLVVTVAYPKVKGYVPLTVLSGSMEPTYPAGSQVFVEPIEGAQEAQDKVGVGSAITFMPYPDDSTLVTHRVVEVSFGTDGQPRYTTQGDANETPDETEIGTTQLRGVVRYHVPWVGYVATSMDAENKGTLARLLAGGLFVYALWNLLAAARERRRPAPGDDDAD